MSTIYIYNNCVSGYLLKKNIDNSEMVDKLLEKIIWNKDSDELKIQFTNPLSTEDKTILDNIVLTIKDIVFMDKSKIQILDEIFLSADPTGDHPTQQERFVNVLNTVPVFITAIESACQSGLWSFARGLVSSNTGLTPEDKALMLSILPE